MHTCVLKPHAPSQEPVINKRKTFHSISQQNSFGQKLKETRVILGIFLVLASSIEEVTAHNVLLQMKPFRSNCQYQRQQQDQRLTLQLLLEHFVVTLLSLSSLLAIPVPSCSIFTCTCLPINTSLRHTPAVVLLKSTALQPLTLYFIIRHSAQQEH